MVVLGALAGVSVSALFFAGFLPGFVMALALMALVYYQSKRGILPGGEVRVSWAATGRAGLDAILPLMMPVIIFGGILGGVFSATEAAAVAVLYATIVGMLIYREIGLRSIYRIFVETAVITGAIGLILGAAAGFANSYGAQRAARDGGGSHSGRLQESVRVHGRGQSRLHSLRSGA